MMIFQNEIFKYKQFIFQKNYQSVQILLSNKLKSFFLNPKIIPS